MPLISDEDWSAQQGQMGLQPVGHPDGLRMTPHEFEAPRRTNVPAGAEMFGTDEPGAPVTTPSSSEVWSSAFEKENDVLNVARYLNRETDFGPVDPEHNPLDVIKGTELEEYRDSFLTSRNAAETNAIKESLERQLENNRILAAGGAVEAFLAMGVASVLSPTTLLPFGTVMRGARLGRAALQTAGRTGAWTGAAIGAQEVVLQSVQETRTLNESLLNVGSGVVLGGLLGAGASAFGSRRLAKVSAAIDRDIATARAIKDGTLDAGAEFDRFVGGGRPAPGAMADAGAAVTRPLAEAEMAGSMGLGRAFAWTNPLSRVMQSSIRASRNAITRLAEVPFLLKQNERGIPTGPEGGTVETRIKVDGDLALYRMQSAIYDAFAEHRFQDPKAWFAQSRAWIEGRGPNKLTFTEFKQEVTKALRSETAEHGIQHPVPEVKKAAEHIRKDLFNRFRDEASKLGLFPKDADFLSGYMMRRYDVPKILAEHTKFRDILVDWLSKGQARAADQLARLERELAAKQADAAPTPEIAQLRQAIDDIKQRWAVDPEMLDTHMGMWERVVQRNPKKPETLSEWVKRNGGIKDEAREVEHMLGSRKEAGRIIDNKRGSSLDDMALRAWEQGFFGARADRPTIREFLDLLDEDVRSGRSVRAQDDDALTDWDMAQEFRADLEASGALTTTSPDRARRLITQWLREQSPVEQTVRADLHADRQTLAGLREQLARAETDEERALIRAEIDKLSDNMGDVQAALSGMEARRAADGGPTAEELDAIYGEAFRQLNAGQPIRVDKAAVAAQLEFASGYQHALPEGTRFGAMERVRPDPKDSMKVLVDFVSDSGEPINITLSRDLLMARALYVREFDAVLFPTFSVRQVGRHQATGIYHEAVHAWFTNKVLDSVSHDVLAPVARNPLNRLDPVVRDRLVAHANFLQVMDMQLGTVLRAIGDPTWRGPNGVNTIHDIYSGMYSSTKAPQEVVADLLDQEAVAHMQELHLAGFFDDADVAPVLDDLMALRGGSPAAAVPDQTDAIADLMGRFGIDPDEFSVIVSRLTEASQSDDPVTSATEILQDVVARYGMDVDPEQIGEIARAFSDFGPEGITDTLAALSGGRSPLGFTSRLDEVLSTFRPTDTVTLDTLSKKGVKKAELEARGLSDLLDGKGAKVSDLQEVAGKNRVEVKDVKYGGDNYKRYATQEEALSELKRGTGFKGKLTLKSDDNNPQVFSVIGLRSRGVFQGSSREYLGKIVGDAGGWRLTGFDRYEPPVGEFAPGMSGKAKWSSYSLDPDNPTYRETVLHLPSSVAERELPNTAGGWGSTDPDGATMANPEWFRQNFTSGHWSEPNVVAHARTSIQKDAQGNDVFVVNELQSDWGQKLRDGGVRDEAKIAVLNEKVEAAERAFSLINSKVQNALSDKLSKFDLSLARDNEAAARAYLLSHGYADLESRYATAHAELSRYRAELRLAESSSPGHPLVNTTDQWVNTGLRKMIMEAVESGADQIAIPSGDTVLSFGMGGKSDGIKYAYDQMYPKNLRNILKKIDPSIEPQKVDHLYGQKGQALGRSQGFVTFKITDKVRSSIQSEGMPLFAVGGGRIEPPRRGPEVSPEILGLAQAIATRFGMEMPDLAAKSFDDQISLLEKFLGQAEKVAQKGLKTATGEMQDILNQLDELRFFANANRQELEDIANETIAKITGSPAGRMINPFDSEFLQGKAGPLQARTLRIPDLHISDKGHAFADFLDDDIERVASSYVRSMAPDIALTREFGDLNLTETLRQIEDEAARLSEAQPENSAQIQKQKTKDMRDLQDIVKRLRGTYNVNHDPSAWGPWTARRLKEWNVLRLMGAVVVSSIPDVMRLLMVHGFRNNADVFRTFAVDLKSLRIPKDQAKEMSAGLEFVMSKAGPMWDAFDDFGGHSRFDQTMQAATKKFGRLSLMDAWNSTLKQLSGAMTTSRVLRASVELSEGRISPKDLRKLAKSGISEDMALEIAKQYKQHGGMHGHLWLANANAWDQTDLAKRAAQALRAAVRKEADITIVTPGQEKPLWTSTHVGSVLAQFRTFQLVSVQRTLIPAVQEADAAIIVAVAGMIGLGMLSERLKQIVHGKKGGPETTGDWLYAGVANSGVLGWITDADQTLHKASRGNVSAARLLFGSDRPISRFASQNVTGSMLGPSFGAGQDLVTAFGGATTGDLSQGDIRAMRRLLPYQNLFYLSRALRAGEQGAMEAAGVPERRAN